MNEGKAGKTLSPTIIRTFWKSSAHNTEEKKTKKLKTDGLLGPGYPLTSG